MSLQRTRELVTCGITNIPLTKPARLFFIVKEKIQADIDIIYSIYDNLKVDFSRTDIPHTGNIRFISTEEVPSDKLKMVWNNFKSLHPKFDTKWKYLLWELDELNNEYFEEIVGYYGYLELPLYVHRTMRGWHFISIKPITNEVWRDTCNALQYTNPDFPRITLRIKPNKYINEERIFNQGYCIMEKYHYDTNHLRNLIISGNYEVLGQKYQLVYYPFDGKEHDRFE
jgi:hypothetical protein